MDAQTPYLVGYAAAVAWADAGSPYDSEPKNPFQESTLESEQWDLGFREGSADWEYLR